jgi:phosphoribosyl 1,2-cyclic phosphate phosphodiesterase
VAGFRRYPRLQLLAAAGYGSVCGYKGRGDFKTRILLHFHDEKYPGVPDINLHHIDSNPFEIGPLHVIPLEVMHYKLPVLGFRIGDLVTSPMPMPWLNLPAN